MVPDPVDLAAARRALVIKLRHHGDVLLASPVFAALKAAAPHLEVDALVYDDTAEMLTFHPAITHVHAIGRKWRQLPLAARLRNERALLATLRARRFDLVVHLTDHPRGVLLARLLGVPSVVAPDRADGRWWWRRVTSHRFPVLRNGRRHTVEMHLDALRRIGVQPGAGDRRLVLVPGVAAEDRVAELLATHGLPRGGFVHFHPASRWRFKCWPLDQCVAMVDALAARGHRIVLTGAPGEVEEDFAASIVARVRSPVVNLAGRLSLKELAALTAAARVFVGVDSAPMHIACAMRTPVVALFGPTSEVEWGPWQASARVIASPAHPCRPCGLDGCGGGKVSECLTSIAAIRVIDAVESLVAHAGSAR